MLKQLTIGLAILVPMFALANEKKAKDDGESIRGTWKVTSSIEAGKERKLSGDMHFVFAADTLTIQKGKDDALGMKYTLDATNTPKWIDTSHEIDPGKPIVQLGIYALEGDTLKLSLESAGKPRPTTFESSAKSTSVVFVLKRSKPARDTP